MSKKRLGGAWVDHEDHTQYVKLHRQIFGHEPLPDLSGRRLCIHPQHDRLTQVMTAPGVGVDLPFDFEQVRHDLFLTDDERELRERRG